MRQAAAVALLLAALSAASTATGARQPRFKALAFYTGIEDRAHVSFDTEANRWLADLAATRGFSYEATTDWTRLRADLEGQYQVVLFLDTRPDGAAERAAFRHYMDHGGGWLGFHFSGFALTPSKYPQDWDWYHDDFLGAGQYVSNTWRPTAAVLRVEHGDHPAMRGLPATFRSAPSEWYRWEHDLRTRPDIRILLSIDPSSFPLGTGPKPDEIWHDGYYPVAWTNTRYRMVYMNMGHNDIDYEGKTNRDLSSTFSSASQNQFITQALLWLGDRAGSAGP